MTPSEADLEGVLEEANNLMIATRYRDALTLIAGAIERWDATLSPPQRFRLRGICAHCEYFGGEIGAAEATLTALIRDREQARAFDLGYLSDIRTLGFVKRALCEFDEGERLLRGVEAQLERNKHDAYCSQLLEEVKKDIADTLTIKAGERTKADLTVHRIEVMGVFGKRTIAVGPLEIPSSAMDLSCSVRALQLVFNTLHSATLHVEFGLDNTKDLPPWGDAGTEALPVLFLLMLPRFGKVHHGRFHLDINGDETIRKQVVLENHRFLIVHPQSYQPHSQHPIPRCRTYRYAEGACAVFRSPAPPRARIRFKGQVDFARGPDEAGITTTAEVARSLWILLPYGAVDLPLPSITALSGNINLVSSAVSRAPFAENSTGFSAGTQRSTGVRPPHRSSGRPRIRRNAGG